MHNIIIRFKDSETILYYYYAFSGTHLGLGIIKVYQEFFSTQYHYKYVMLNIFYGFVKLMWSN